jgi:SAM-dependent methyltransferase
MAVDAALHRRILDRIGLGSGQHILDFGDGELRVLVCNAAEQDLTSLSAMPVSADLHLPFEDASFDAVLLHDVSHAYRHPTREARMQLLHEFWRVLKCGGVLSFHPTPSAGYWGVTPGFLCAEVGECGFTPAGEVSEDVVVRGLVEKVTVHLFRKV